MFHAIAKAFKSLDDFLTGCDEYVEQRVWNGKFIYDLRFLSYTTIDNTKKALHDISEYIKSSRIFIAIVSFFQKLTGLLMQIQIVEDIALLILEGFRLCIKYLAHYLIVLIAGLASAFLLLMTFKYAIIVFFLLLLPIIYINHLFLTSFFTLVEKKEEGIRYTFSDSINQLKLALFANTFIFLQQTTLVVTSGILLLGFSFFLTYVFGFVNIVWSSSFLYWLPVVMLGLLIALFLYIAQVTLSFAYSFVLQEKGNASQALRASFNHLQTNPRHSMLFYTLLTFISIFCIGLISSNTYEGGFVTSILFTNHVFLWLGFLLQRKYFKESVDTTISPINKLQAFFKPALGLGVLSYLLTAGLVVQLQPDILLYIEQQRPTIAANYKYTKYTNTSAGYSIDYPRPWSLYRWDNFSTTIYTNVTGTEAGGIKVNIDVRDDNGSPYFMLYEANPGLITFDTGTKNVTTKIANVVLRGKNAVKYTYTKTDAANPEYQIHYLIHHNNKVYDIAFITVSKKTEVAYNAIFDRMIESFTLEAETK